MKTVYFVRHGQTSFNAERRFNTPDASLSEEGRQQAAEIADRTAKLPIEAIVTSTLPRAKQTAEIIAKTLDKKLYESDLFVEGGYTKKFYGAPVDSPESAVVSEEYFGRFCEPGYRPEDGEGFDDFKKRALASFSYIEQLPEREILVVTHAFFLWFIGAAAIFGEELTAKECLGVLKGLDLMENTAITIVTFDAPARKAAGEPTAKWQLNVWNDHAHL